MKKKIIPVILQLCHPGQCSSPTQNSLSSTVTVWQPPVHPSQMVPGCHPTITGSRSPFPRWQRSSHPTLRMLVTSSTFEPENGSSLLKLHSPKHSLGYNRLTPSFQTSSLSWMANNSQDWCPLQFRIKPQGLFLPVPNWCKMQTALRSQVPMPAGWTKGQGEGPQKYQEGGLPWRNTGCGIASVDLWHRNSLQL